MKVRTLCARRPGGAITPKKCWCLYAENETALLYAGNSQLKMEHVTIEGFVQADSVDAVVPLEKFFRARR